MRSFGCLLPFIPVLSISSILCLWWTPVARAQGGLCKSPSFISPDPLLVPAEGGLFEYTVQTEVNTFCSCFFTTKVDVFIPIPDRPGFPVLRGERVEEPSSCIHDYPWIYPRNDGPTRTMTVFLFRDTPAADRSNAVDTIRVIQEGFGGGGPGSGGGANSSLSAIYARDDFVVAYRDAVLSYPVLKNDAASAGLDRGSIRIVEQGQNGMAATKDDETVSYTPRPGVFGEDSFTYTVMDTEGTESNAATVSVIVKDEPPFTGCEFTRPNQQIHFHHPSLYLPEVQQIFSNPPLSVGVQVLQDGVPIGADAMVSLSASTAVFPGDSGLPELAQATDLASAGGLVDFAINPPKPGPSDTISLDAVVNIDGTEYPCLGTLSVGLGSRLEPYVSALDNIASSQAAVAEAERDLMARPATSPSNKIQGEETERLKFRRLPMFFEPSGRAGEAFVARINGRRVQVASSGASLPRKDGGAPVQLRLIDAAEKVEGRSLDPLRGRSHYLLGSDPVDWKTNIPQVAKVRFDGVYDGVDIVYYGVGRRLEYDFIVEPHTDPDTIRMQLSADATLTVDDSGHLVAPSAGSWVRMEKPFAYQEVNGKRIEIAAAYEIEKDNHIRFNLGEYDESRELVIDPVLDFSSFLGGSADDAISDIALDADGNIYVAGSTSSPGLATAGAFQGAREVGGLGEADAFVAKLDPTGSTLLYLTYFGGAGDESAFGVAIDGESNVLLTGTTSSLDFPVAQAYQTRLAHPDALGFDSFVLKLSADGSNLVYSTYLGGTGVELEGAIAVDSSGNAYVASSTTSVDLPITNALQEARGGAAAFSADAVIAKFDPMGQAVFVTYLGGAREDWGFGIDVDSEGAAWVTGMSSSIDFPAVDAFQNANRGGFDAFIAKINAAGDELLYSSYLGGSSDDSGQDIAVDGGGSPYVVGSTGSGDFPATGGVQAEPLNAEGMGQDAFVAKFSPDGATLNYATYLGGSGDDLGQGIAVASDGSAYVSGDTTSLDLPATEAFQGANRGGYDGFSVKLNAAGSAFDYATYIGGSGHDGASGIAVDDAGNAFVAGVAFSPDFPVTIGSFQESAGSRIESFVAKLSPGAPQPAITSVSAASFSRAFGISPESIASGFGAGFATAVEVALSTPLPTTLAGTSVKVIDSTQTERLAQLFFVSPGQINYLFPAGVALGLATVVVEVDGQVVATETVRVNAVAPSLFTANAAGTGVAAAFFLRIAADGTRTQDLLFDAGLAPVALDLGPEGDQVFLLLFGTGVRGFTGQVTATINGVNVAVLGAVAHPDFVGLDQVNIGPIPRSLIGAGEVQLVITVDGVSAPPVTVLLQ